MRPGCPVGSEVLLLRLYGSPNFAHIFASRQHTLASTWSEIALSGLWTYSDIYRQCCSRSACTYAQSDLIAMYNVCRDPILQSSEQCISQIRLHGSWATLSAFVRRPYFAWHFTLLTLKTFRFWQTVVVDPSATMFYYWSMVMMVAVLYNLMIVIMRSVFTQLHIPDFVPIWLCLDYTSDFLYLWDMFIKSRIGKQENHLLSSVRYFHEWCS